MSKLTVKSAKNNYGMNEDNLIANNREYFDNFGSYGKALLTKFMQLDGCHNTRIYFSTTVVFSRLQNYL